MFFFRIEIFIVLDKRFRLVFFLRRGVGFALFIGFLAYSFVRDRVVSWCFSSFGVYNGLFVC